MHYEIDSLNKNINDLIKLEQESRDHNRQFPLYSNFPDTFETLISELRTDLDHFNDIEIDLLMWAGAIRMDLAIKSLFPNLFDNDLWEMAPTAPEYSLELMKEVLYRGKKRRIFFNPNKFV